jgi:serine/threonine protein kinase
MDGRAKLTDFGMSTSTDLDDGRQSTAGTYGYAAPEMLKKGQTYNLPADMWAFGELKEAVIMGYVVVPYDQADGFSCV